MIPLRIVADRHIWHVEDAFSCLKGYNVALKVVEADDITTGSLRHADVLLTRSSTQVNAALLASTPVRFVATATVGDDHIDLRYLKESGIAFASAAGSSTGSVIEYMMTALLKLQTMNHLSLNEHTLGIIGAGRIGSQLAALCQSLGIKTLSSDAPRKNHESDTCLISLELMLQQADVLTIHTPLVRSGKHHTHYLINADVLAKFRGFGIINTARGACVDNHALLDWLNKNQQNWAVLDCWQREPNPDQALLQHPRVVIGTPHIAGHSLDGKANNTQYIYNALCAFLRCPASWNRQDVLPPARPPLVLPKFSNMWDTLSHMAENDYPIMDDHQSICHKADARSLHAFRHYRRHYPVRRAWHTCRWLTDDKHTQLLINKLQQ
ncbi:MAG: 4-phosphoerythronate dehydrogenase [Mariprofundaceae bacterium]|nr:4-phosphoerythronate dehydrogenase [Mariprofundaceae bacterium]